ncbi:hypothetical protein D3C74_441120 [compost metagenome]
MAKWLFGIYGITDMQPWNIVLKNTEEIRAAVSADYTKVAIYVPINTVLKLNVDLSEYDFTVIDLENRRFGTASISVQEQITIIGMHDFEADVLLIGIRK